MKVKDYYLNGELPEGHDEYMAEIFAEKDKELALYKSALECIRDDDFSDNNMTSAGYASLKAMAASALSEYEVRERASDEGGASE